MTRKLNLILFFLILIFILIGCEQPQASQPAPSISAKEELQQLLQKASSIKTLDITYTMQMNILSQSLINMTTRQIKQENKQRQDGYGTMLGFPVNTRSTIIDGQQVTCAVFENVWKCDQGKEVCQETSKGKQCMSVSEEGFPTIKPEQLENADVTSAGTRQLLGTTLQCYDLKKKESGQQVSIQICLNQDGLILLMISETKGAQLRLEAKSYSTTIEPDAFIIPTT